MEIFKINKLHLNGGLLCKKKKTRFRPAKIDIQLHPGAKDVSPEVLQKRIETMGQRRKRLIIPKSASRKPRYQNPIINQILNIADSRDNKNIPIKLIYRNVIDSDKNIDAAIKRHKKYLETHGITIVY